MASTKISDYSTENDPASGDYLIVAREDTANYKIPFDQMRSNYNYSRPKFSYVDTDTITIGPGGYYLDGVGWCYWTSDLTFDLGSGGSNANSDDLTASEWHYIAIDYSSVSSAGVLTASNFINREDSNVTPAYSGSKGGWYQDTDDRTIFGVLTNGSSQVLEFWHDGGNFVKPSQNTTELNGGGSTAFTDIDCSSSMPKFSSAGYGYFRNFSSAVISYRKNGSSDSTGTKVVYSDETISRVMTDTSQIFEYKVSTGTADFHMSGWFFPAGM